MRCPSPSSITETGDDIHVLDGRMPAKKTKTKKTQRVPYMKTKCDYLYGWIKKKTITYAKISPKMVNPRDRAGNVEEEEEW